jgi:hypothetical protein
MNNKQGKKMTKGKCFQKNVRKSYGGGMANGQDIAGVVKGKCLTCFYLTFRDMGESFVCAKYNFEPKGAVECCRGFRPIDEGLAELIASIKARGEFPEWV